MQGSSDQGADEFRSAACAAAEAPRQQDMKYHERNDSEYKYFELAHGKTILSLILSAREYADGQEASR